MDITKQYDKACEAVERGNDDYAIKLFQEILSVCPDHLESRQKLREAARSKFRKEGVKSAGVGAYVKGIVPLIKMHLFTLMRKYDQSLQESEKFLALDPDNVLALNNLGKAAAAMPQGLPTAIWAYESIIAVKPNDTKKLATLGALYEEVDNVEKASECFERITRLKPEDREVQTKLRDLAAHKTIKRGWDSVGEKGSFTSVMRDKDQMEDRSGEEEVIRTADDLERNIERVKGDIAREAGNKKLVIQLGDLYRRGKRWDDARAEYLKAKEIDRNDGSIDERIGDLRIERYNEDIYVLEEEIRKSTAGEGAKEKVKALAAERDQFATREYAARVKLRPTELPLQYKLGQLYYNASDIDNAHAHFQHAKRSPQFRRSAGTYCGLCLCKKGMFDLAVQEFEEAIGDTVTIDREEKNILYNLGLAAEKLGDIPKAEEAYKKIFSVDVNYRDVKSKIEVLYKKREKGSGNAPAA
ncbi:MAG TPA: tetratricopeptide repeat protein [Planctomycetota bacterium]|nr:tetratricopeptide repeat protein [Planctomycetota bacterium]